MLMLFRKIKITRAFILFFSLFLLFPAIVQARQVRVGVYANKPLVYKNEQGLFQGLAIDVLRSAAEQNDWQLEFVEGTWAQCLQRLKEGRIDLQVAIADSPNRRKLYEFTTTPLITNWGRVYSQEHSSFDSLLDLQNKTIGVIEGDIHATIFADLLKKFDLQVTLKSVADYDSVFQAIADKIVDAGVVNRMYAMQNANRFAVLQTPMIFNPIRVCYAVPLGKNRSLLSTLNTHMIELKNDPDSIYYQSLERWFDQEQKFRIPVWLSNTLIILSVLLVLFFIILMVLKRQIAVKTEALNESRKRYQTLFSRSTDAIFVSNMKGEIIDANHEACRSLGYTLDELRELTLPQVDGTAVEEKHVEVVWSQLDGGKTATIESVHIRKDGSCFPVEVHIGKVEVLGKSAVLGIARDITDRKQIEQERDQALQKLASERERLSITLRSIGDGVIATDEKGIIVFINRITELLTGWPEDEAIGHPIQEVFHIINEKTGKRCENPVRKIFEQERIVGFANHTVLIARDGTRRNITDSCAPIRDRDSNIIGTVLVFQDVTLEKKTEEELIKIKKLESIGILAGGIAHDFNNILSAILGNINLANQYLDVSSKAKPLLEEAEKATTRAKDLTQQLLTFSKGGMPIKKIEHLSEIIRESADLILHGTNVVCEYQIPDDLWMVEVDRGQIGQVIQNLVINSCQAMVEGGVITISCSNVENENEEIFQGLYHGKYVKIVLRDTGIGIPEQMLDKIFDPYFSTKQEGSGLGLAITHAIINKHDGYIQVDSQAGRGTTFTFYLQAC